MAPRLAVSFTPVGLRFIVYNLLSDAIKHRAARVQLWAESQLDTLVLAVRDNGLGLDEMQQRHLFQVCQRLHTHVEGIGVGLCIIKRLIDNAGVTITVTSAPRVGTSFTVTFPLHRP
jgi:signal transduction histidine kinase